MLVLGLDTATRVCAVALVRDEQLVGEYTQNIRKTHSQRLLPLIDTMLTDCTVEREQIGGIAVAVGPGSFTGLRIGVSTARALAQGLGIPAAGVSTLEAMAEQVFCPGALVCPLLDARRGEVYTALYHRLPEPPYSLKEIVAPTVTALPLLLQRLAARPDKIFFLGEGVAVHNADIASALAKRAVMLPAPLRLNRAALVALCGARRLADRPTAGQTYHHLRPLYLRRPEAERRQRKEMDDHH